MEWELTKEERLALSESDRVKYDRAVSFKGDGWACGPFGGWVRGNDILESLGWTKQKRTEGHRTFISIIKPQ